MGQQVKSEKPSQIMNMFEFIPNELEVSLVTPVSTSIVINYNWPRATRDCLCTTTHRQDHLRCALCHRTKPRNALWWWSEVMIPFRIGLWFRPFWDNSLRLFTTRNIQPNIWNALRDEHWHHWGKKVYLRQKSQAKLNLLKYSDK